MDIWKQKGNDPGLGDNNVAEAISLRAGNVIDLSEGLKN